MNENLESVRVMNLQEGDTLVLKSKNRLSIDQWEKIHSMLKKQYPYTNILLLENDFEVEILRDGEEQPHHADST